MRVLVTGASGYLGARLYTDLSHKFETYGTYHKQSLFPEFIKLELGNEAEVLSTIKRIAPNLIIHAAAIPTAALAKESGKESTFDTNVNGTERIVKAAIEVKAKVVYISTGAANNPIETYGFTKKQAEDTIRTSGIDYLILRLSLVIGKSPNVTNDRFQNRLLKNIMGETQAKYENSALWRVTWIGHITEVIERSIEDNISNETISILAPEKNTRFQIANDILKEFNVKCTPFIEENKPQTFTTTTDKLSELNLPIYSYKQIIDKTVQELKEQISQIKN